MSREERNVHYDPEQMAPPHDQLDDLSKTGDLPDDPDVDYMPLACGNIVLGNLSPPTNVVNPLLAESELTAATCNLTSKKHKSARALIEHLTFFQRPSKVDVQSL